MSPRSFTLNFLGDCMLGRLIDQLLPTHVTNADEASIVKSFRNSAAHLIGYSHRSVWGDTLPLLHAADLTLCNLETAATTHAEKWPDKVFNYRMHPDNVRCLAEAHVRYAGLANNHTLDFRLPGLLETVRTLKQADIAFAGAGKDKGEAQRPAILHLPATSLSASDERQQSHEVHVWAASDHPRDWSSVPNFHLIDYSAKTRERLKALINPLPDSSSSITVPSLKIFSVHWGPNYSWQPAQEIQDLAHYVIDECGIDIVHGHSSHHIQGVEIYNGSLIIYGCGDFVDDYALVRDYRNDLSAVWKVTVQEAPSEGSRTRLRPTMLEIFPTKIDRFQARKLMQKENDYGWLIAKSRELCIHFGTQVDDEVGENGQLIVRVDSGSDCST